VVVLVVAGPASSPPSTLVSEAVRMVVSAATAVVVVVLDVVVVDVVLTTISVGASAVRSVTFCVASDAAPPQPAATTIATSVARSAPFIIPPLPFQGRFR
jgi:hypothetical protein